MAQFVPLKVETRGENWSKWASKYAHDGKGIPIIYIVRADGEQLYGKTGSKSGNELPQFLVAQLRQAGRILAPRVLDALADAVDKAEAALESDDLQTANRQVRRISKIGRLGELGSFAKPALEANALVQKLTEHGNEKISKAESMLSDKTTRFAGLILLASVKRNYSSLPGVKKPLAQTIRTVKKDRGTRDLFAQAVKIDRVHVTLAKRKGRETTAINALKRIADQNPNTSVSRYAVAWIERLKSGDHSAPPVSWLSEP